MELGLVIILAWQVCARIYGIQIAFCFKADILNFIWVYVCNITLNYFSFGLMYDVLNVQRFLLGPQLKSISFK